MASWSSYISRALSNASNSLDAHASHTLYFILMKYVQPMSVKDRLTMVCFYLASSNQRALC